MIIRVTGSESRTTIYVNTRHMHTFYRDGNRTMIVMENGHIFCSEQPEQIMAMIPPTQ